ncbi:hypothetical protein CTA2_8115 [Colletotrichum tanaceti]|nr:hypothetical protein CTA2_8115 [Colletotrichum tanaceti]
MSSHCLLRVWILRDLLLLFSILLDVRSMMASARSIAFSFLFFALALTCALRFLDFLETPALVCAARTDGR